MSYTVLARKWRPQTFEEVVGQNHIIQTLQNALTGSRIAHAYLFTGARGVGKTTVARLLAKALNCDHGPTKDPCNKCQSCIEITKGSSIDVIEIDGASNTGVDDVREIRDNIRYLPSRSRYKVYIIDEVHMLSISAFNALLKTLEEPPPHTVFIFATTEPHKIPLTVLSRCQRFDFKRLPLTKIKRHLKKIADVEGIDIDERAVFLLSREADGSMRDAQSLLDQIVASRGLKVRESDVVETLGLFDKGLIQEIAIALLRKDGEGCIKLVEKAYEFGYDEKRFWQEIIRLFRDLILLKTIDHPEGLIELYEEEIEILKEEIKCVGVEELHCILKSLIQGFEDLSRSPYPRLALEITLLKIVSLPPVISIKELFERIDTLEKRTQGFKGIKVLDGTEALETNLKVQDLRNPTIGFNPKSTDPKPIEDLKEEGLNNEEWKEFLVFVKGKRPPLYAHLKYASPVLVSEDLLKIAIKEGIHYDYLTEHERIEYLTSLFKEFSKRPVKIMIEKDGSYSDTKINSKEDSFVKEVIDIFGGEVCNPKLN